MPDDLLTAATRREGQTTMHLLLTADDHDGTAAFPDGGHGLNLADVLLAVPARGDRIR